MDNKHLKRKILEFENTTRYLMKLSSDLRALTSVSTEVLKRKSTVNQIKAKVRAKFYSKNKPK